MKLVNADCDYRCNLALTMLILKKNKKSAAGIRKLSNAIYRINECDGEEDIDFRAGRQLNS